MSAGNMGFTIGSSKEKTTQASEELIHSGSTVGSLLGNTVLLAGNTYTQHGSTVSSPMGDVLIQAKEVNIIAAEDTFSSDYRHDYKQSGLTVALSVPIVDAVQSAVDSAKTIGKSKNNRVNAMAVANTAWNSYQAYEELGKLSELAGTNNPVGAQLSITLGSQRSTSTSHTEGNSASSSSVTAGGSVVIKATGGGKDSNINIIGSDVAGGKGTHLMADNDINILAFEEYQQERSKNSSSGWNAGVTIGPKGIGYTIGGNKGKGHANADDITYRYSHVGDLNSVTTITSGGATNIIGGQVYGEGVKIDAKELNVVSLQETSTYDSKQKNISGSITVGAGVSGSGSYNKSKIKSDYASVNEQSGIYAGDKGFQINVEGNTNLVGAIITSTDKAELDGKNSLTTGTLTYSDLENHSNYKGEAIGIGAGFSVGGSAETEPQKNNPITSKIPLMNVGPDGVSKSIGYGSDKGSESSTTGSGIYTGNITITDANKQKELTGKSVEDTIKDIKTDTNTDLAMEYQGLENIFDRDKVQKEIDLQVKVTQDFDKNRQEMKLEINKKIDEYKDKDPAKAEQWRNIGLILDSISAGLYAPSESIGGSLVAAASPILAKQIGDYFAGLRDDKGNLSIEDNISHKLAHGILGAAVAAATGGDATNGFLAGAGGELLGEMVTKWLYPDKEPSDLTAEEKNLVSSIVGLGSAGLGLATGNGTTDIATGNLISTNAVENNFLTGKRPLEYAERLAACNSDNQCERKIRKEIAQESADNINKLKACWESGDFECVLTIQNDLQAAESSYYTELAKQDYLVGHSYEQSAAFYADIIEHCAGKCGWLEAQIAKTTSESMMMAVYGALAMGSIKPNSSNGKGENGHTNGNSIGALDNASKTAFDAAKNDILSWTPKDKHMLGTTANRSAQFSTNNISEIQNLVAEALNSPNAIFLPNNQSGSFRVIVNMGRAIGTKGQQNIRVIIGNDGKIWNAFPVNSR